VAAVNAPSSCVLSGTFEEMAIIEEKLKQRGIAAVALRTSHAFHSAMMDPICEPFRKELARVQFKPPEIPFISNVTGQWITPEQAIDPRYWVAHLRQTVLFADGITTLLGEADCALIEVGPGRVLSTLTRQQTSDESRHLILGSLPPPKKTSSEEESLLTSLGRLWIEGATINWRGFYAHQKRCRVSLPSYPFERRRFWIEAGPSLQSKTDSDNPIERSSIGAVGSQPEDSCVEQEGQAPSRCLRPDLATPYVEPSTGCERKIVEIWREFLGDVEIGIRDDFFELGGHSLMATQMATRLREAFRIDLPIAEIFAATTVAELAPIVERTASMTSGLGENGLNAPDAIARSSAPLSFAQLRLWFLEAMSPASGLYNVPAAMRLEGPLDAHALEQSIGEIVRRHESLRTTFTTDGDEPVQVVHPDVRFTLPVVEM
jgi:acyl carrier protein